MAGDGRGLGSPNEATVDAITGRAAQTWTHFLKVLQAEAGLARDLAERAAASIMCALEQRLKPSTTEDLSSHLPLRLREILQRCGRHSGCATACDRASFLAIISEDLGVETEDAEFLVRVVLEVVRGRLTDPEIEDVTAHLPQDLRDLWAPPA